MFPALPDVSFTGLDADEDGTEGSEGDVAVISAPDLARLAAWVVGVADYRDNVRSCPWVAEVNLIDLRDARAGRE